MIVGKLSANIKIALKNNQCREFTCEKPHSICMKNLKDNVQHGERIIFKIIHTNEEHENNQNPRKTPFETVSVIDGENVQSIKTEETAKAAGNGEKFLDNPSNETSIQMEEPNKVVSILTNIRMDKSCFDQSSAKEINEEGNENDEDEQEDGESAIIFTVIGNHLASFTSIVSKLKLVPNVLPDLNSSSVNSDGDNVSTFNNTTESNSMEPMTTNQIKNDINDKKWRHVRCLDLNGNNEADQLIDSNAPSTSREKTLKTSEKFWISLEAQS